MELPDHRGASGAILDDVFRAINIFVIRLATVICKFVEMVEGADTPKGGQDANISTSTSANPS